MPVNIAPGRYTINADHLHTCQQHSGDWYAAHERIFTVVPRRRLRRIGRHGALRHAQNPDRVLINAAKRKVDNYRLDYLQDGKAFLPLIASTSGRLHGEFVRFLYFLAHKRAMDFFAAIGQAHPSHNELCQQRGAFFYQHRSRVGVACAQACALRIGGAAPPRRQAPLQGANAHALQEDLDANWGG